MYAERKGLPLLRTTVRLRHDPVQSKDCEQCEHNVEMLSAFAVRSTSKGP